MKDLKTKKINMIYRLFPLRKNKCTRHPRKQWWWLAAAINVAETTDCLLLDDEGYEIEYNLWKPGGYKLDMAAVERLALLDNKYGARR